MGPNMIDEATLATMIGGFLWLVYHCREWKREKGEFSQWMDSRFEAFAVRSGDAMEVLEDILDGLGAASPPSVNQATGGLIPELLTLFLNNQMTMPSEHGTKEGRAVQEEVSDPPTPKTQDEHNERSGDISSG